MRKLLICMLIMIMLPLNIVFAADLSDWAEEEYKEANEAGLVCYNVVLNNMQENITREEFCELSVRLYQSLSDKALPDIEIFPFDDCDNYTVAQAYALGIVSGVSDTEFAPGESVTREEMAKILVNTLEACDVEVRLTKKDREKILQFDDDNQISDWAKNSIVMMVKLDVINGVSENSIFPKGSATREQAIAIVNRSYSKFCDNSNTFVLPNITSVKDGVTINEDFTLKWAQTDDAQEYRIIIKDESSNDKIVYTTKKQNIEIDRDKLKSGIKYTVIINAVLENNIQVFSMPVDFETAEGNQSIGTQTDTPAPKAATSEKKRRIFEGEFYYIDKEEAKKNMVEVEVDVWNIDKNGEKVPSKLSLTIHKNLAEDVKKIFKEIFDDKGKFPIKSCGGFQWRNAASGRLSQHSYGTCIDINPNENYYVSVSGQALSGSYWKPNEDPYSVTEDGIVVKTFAKYGFLWGGNAWGENSSKDYMHFTYLGN